MLSRLLSIGPQKPAWAGLLHVTVWFPESTHRSGLCHCRSCMTCKTYSAVKGQRVVGHQQPCWSGQLPDTAGGSQHSLGLGYCCCWPDTACGGPREVRARAREEGWGSCPESGRLPVTTEHRAGGCTRQPAMIGCSLPQDQQGL